jgi:hypothetical protein
MTSMLQRAVKLNESRKTVMKHRASSGVAVSSVALLCAALAACAGKVTPSVSDDLADAIEDNYTGAGGSAAVGNAGAAGAAATGNPGRGNAGGSSNAAGGAAGAGDDDVSGGAAGAAMNGAAGSSMAGGAGASGDPDEGGAGAPTCNGFAVLAANCGSSGCHGAGSNLGTFAASEEDARDYIGVAGTVCSGQGSIIDTDDPAASLLVTKVSDDPPCAQPMPLGGPPLAQSDIDCIEDWISGL